MIVVDNDRRAGAQDAPRQALERRTRILEYRTSSSSLLYLKALALVLLTKSIQGRLSRKVISAPCRGAPDTSLPCSLQGMSFSDAPLWATLWRIIRAWTKLKRGA